MELQNRATSMKKSRAVSPQINRTIIQSSNPTSDYISQRIENRVSKRYLHTHIYNNTIFNSQDVKATQVSVDGWMDKQNVLCTYYGILFSLEKEGDPVTHYNMEEPWRLVTKRQILYGSTYVKCLK